MKEIIIREGSFFLLTEQDRNIENILMNILKLLLCIHLRPYISILNGLKTRFGKGHRILNIITKRMNRYSETL